MGSDTKVIEEVRRICNRKDAPDQKVQDILAVINAHMLQGYKKLNAIEAAIGELKMEGK